MNPNPTPAQAVQAALRSHFGAFVQKCVNELGSVTYVDNWHIAALVYRLEHCASGKNTRLIVTQPPRSLKSLIISIAWPAFLLGHDPRTRIIVISYSADLAAKLGRDFRQIVNSAWYRQLFPGTIVTTDNESEFETTRGGFRLALSIGSSITGRGAGIIIIDDPLKPEEALSKAAREKVTDYYRNTLYSRLDDKVTGVIVLVMQRLHDEDLVGVLLRERDWYHLNLPAIATRDERIDIGQGEVHERKAGDVLHPQREPRSALEATKRTIGSRYFEAQYQQAPVAEDGNLINRNWFRYYSILPPRTEDSRVIQSWDTAVKGDEIHDYSVCTTWLVDKGRHYLLDLVRRQCIFPVLKDLALDLYRCHNPAGLLIEDQGSGSSLIQELRRRHQISTIPVRPVGDKVTRFSTASVSFEQGQVYFPKDAPWLAELEDELLRFPQARFDDQADSVSQYLNWDRGRIPPIFEVTWM